MEIVPLLAGLFFAAAALAVLVWAAVRWGIPALARMCGHKERRFSGRDRELLDLIGDLAELYRSTGR